MKINKKKLLAALRIASRVVEKKSHMPILGTVLIANGIMKATNLDIGVNIALDAEMDKDEKFCINCRRLTDIVRSLDAETVEIMAKENQAVKINGYFEVYNMKADEFPDFNMAEAEIDEKNHVTISKGALQRVASSATNEECGFNLAGVYFDGENSVAVASDGHRLHMENVEMSGPAWFLPLTAIRVIMPACKDEVTFKVFKAQQVVVRPESEKPEADMLDGLDKSQLMALNDDYFGLEVSAKGTIKQIAKTMMDVMKEKAKPEYKDVIKNVLTTINGITFVVRTPETRFPDYKAIFPNIVYTVNVKRDDMLPPLEQALSLSSERYKAVKMMFNGHIEMECVNPDIGTYQRHTIPMKGNIEPEVRGGFNPVYLRDIVAMATDDVEIGVPESHVLTKEDGTIEDIGLCKPLVFKHGTFTGLVMPMRV
uniref:Putative DNA polymerase n=1 Tax=viral metagenome TaxID=1070528 RepID=A0A6M3X9K6_9ZZZZ